MKIGKLRTVIKSHNKDQLCYIISEMYKAMPKALKEVKNTDSLIIEGKQATKTIKVKQVVYIDDLESDITEFYDNAMKQLYFTNNRQVNKKRRSQWRFEVIGYYKDLELLSADEENIKTVGILLEKLYNILSYATGYYTFASLDPFYTIKIKQTAFLRTVLAIHRQSLNEDDFIKTAVKIVCENLVDNDTLFFNLAEVLIKFINTPEEVEKALKACVTQINQIKAKSMNHSYSSLLKYRGNDIAELGFMLNLSNGDIEQAILFHKKHRTPGTEKKSDTYLYCLCRLLIRYGLGDSIVKEYELSINSGVEPRNELKLLYKQAKSDNLPKVMP